MHFKGGIMKAILGTSYIVMAMALLIVAVMMSGCSNAITEKLVADETRGNEIAQKYGTPELKQCSQWVHEQVGKFGETDTMLAALRAEPTSGLYSRAMRDALVVYYAKQSFADQSKIDELAKGFTQNCGILESTIRVQIIQDAIKFRP
jgi:hypothetical protein